MAGASLKAFGRSGGCILLSYQIRLDPRKPVVP